METNNTLLKITSLQLHEIGPIDLYLNAGQCISLSGPSGSGKSLLLRAIADLTPHQGCITLNGINQLEINPKTLMKKIHWQWRNLLLVILPSIKRQPFGLATIKPN